MSEQNRGPNWYLTAKYGLYVTLAYEGPAADEPNRACGCYPDGTLPGSLDELADAIDVESFADDCAEMGVEYVTYTLYHAHFYVLYPSAVVAGRLAGHASRRDVIRALLDALHARGIRLQLYIHATIGDTMTDEERAALHWDDAAGGYKKWNDFFNEFFAELCDRYGDDMDSYYFDMVFDQPFLDMIDRTRLYHTMKTHAPKAVVVGNGEGNEAVDYGSREDAMIHFDTAEERLAHPVQTVIGLTVPWWSTVPEGGKSPAQYPADHLLRTMVLTAAANAGGGGLALGATPYITRGFEPGVKETLVALGRLLAPIGESVKNTLPSSAWVTPAGASIPTLYGGFAATAAPDGGHEYIHVLAPPTGNTLHLPPPLDGARFGKTVMLRTGNQAGLVQDAAGITLTIPDEWDELDTVVRLTVTGRQARAEDATARRALLSGGQLRVSASAAVEGHPAENAADGDAATFWCSPTGLIHTLTVDLGQVRQVCAVHVLPRQDGATNSELPAHISSYAVYASTGGEDWRPVATGEWPRTLDEKRAAFPPVAARFLKLTAGPAWLPESYRVFPVTSASAAEVRVEVLE